MKESRFIPVHDLVRGYVRTYIKGLWKSEHFHPVDTSFAPWMDNRKVLALDIKSRMFRIKRNKAFYQA
ncbi:hypothetical protein KPH14_004118 [Odynerus spinipes]|uniref:Uncharacterized protein n=1 Tax=Odynerus spinipes TaxID=1348599 RepID=A0AAD9VV76_9HYME|nr:hypothetical protein KPH14_004118 [Odynerus spinipes]